MTATNVLRLAVGDLDCSRNLLTTRAGEQIALSPIATRLLEMLAARPGEIVTRRELIDDLWDGNSLVGDTALNRVVSELRKATGDRVRSPTLLQTIPRKGYRLVAAPNADGTAPGPAPALATRSWKKGGAIILVIILSVLLLNWLLENLIGLVWTLQHRG